MAYQALFCPDLLSYSEITWIHLFYKEHVFSSLSLNILYVCKVKTNLAGVTVQTVGLSLIKRLKFLKLVLRQTHFIWKTFVPAATLNQKPL